MACKAVKISPVTGAYRWQEESINLGELAFVDREHDNNFSELREHGVMPYKCYDKIC